MKKAVSVLLCALLIFSFAACAKTQPTSVETTVTEAEKGSLKDTVTINLPASMIEPEYLNNLKAYCEDYGYIKAKLSRDGQTVQVTMNRFSHELLLTQMGMVVMSKIAEVTDSGDYPSVKELKKVDKDGFREVVISVDAENYKKDGSSMAPYIIGQSCLLYQAYTEDTDYRCEVVVVDSKTNKVIDTQVYTDKDE